MTDIIEIANKAGFMNHTALIYKRQILKLEQLLREEFIKELGEPVAEAIRERDRLGFAVVNVIGKLDEIIENTQEVEVDDFLHIAVPIDMWNELQASLEEMPKRAELYTSPISKESTEMNEALMAQQVRRKQLNAKKS